MKRLISIILCVCFVSQLVAADVIVTKNNRRYNGTVVRIIDRGFVVRTAEGNVILIPKDSIARIYRDNKVLDFEEGMSYYLEVRRPFLPFVVLGIATGAYALGKYREYQDKKTQAEQAIDDLPGQGQDYTYLDDQSKKALAWSIVSGLFSVGSFYVALRPLEVKVPIGKINLSTTSSGISIALHF